MSCMLAMAAMSKASKMPKTAEPEPVMALPSAPQSSITVRMAKISPCSAATRGSKLLPR